MYGEDNRMSEEGKENNVFVQDTNFTLQIDCIKCGKKTGIGQIIFGSGNSMCLDCGNEFQNWMYDKLVKEWISKNDTTSMS
jgi:DNA-directed RNA polymerase subunit RPC12/RpoP